jgi:hypothetical protein
MGIDPSNSYMTAGLNRYSTLGGWDFARETLFSSTSDRLDESDHSVLTIARKKADSDLYLDVNPPSSGSRNQGFARTMTAHNEGTGVFRSMWSSMPAVTQHFSFLDTSWASGGLGTVSYQQAIRSSVDFRLFTNQSLWQNAQEFAWSVTTPAYQATDHCSFINGMCSISVKEIAG